MVKDKNFWNIRARSYQGYRDKDEYREKMIGIMENHGIVFDGATVLDLGCGNGSYTIRFAKKAEQVTAFDVSDVMLESLKKSACENEVTNIEYVDGDWTEYVPNQKFDIIFASLTPAVQDEGSVKKILNYAKKWVVNIYFNTPMKSDVFKNIYEIHGIDRSARKFEPVMKNYFEKLSIPYSLYSAQGNWTASHNYEEIMNNCRDIVEAHGIEPNIPKIDEYIKTLEDKETGKYVSKTAYDVNMIIYNVL